MNRFAASLLTATLLTAAPAVAEDMPSYADSTLTGNWGGYRDSWAASGITTDIVYKVDVMSVVSGGLHTGTRTLDNLDVIVGFDGEKLFGSKGTSAVIQFLNNMGAEPNGSLVGSVGGVDNIEVTEPTGKLYQAFIQQNWNDDKVSLLAGLYDLNSEFYVTNSSGLFLHPTFGIGTDMAQSGQNGPSIFPTTSLAARLMVAPTDNTYIQAAVLDAVAGDVGDANGTQISLGNNEGALYVAEFGYLPEAGKLAIGAWRYSEDFYHLTQVDALGNPTKDHAQGFYVIGEHELYAEPNAEGQGLVGFARLGFANEAVHQVDYSWALGVNYTGLFAGRDAGQFGFAVNGAHNGGEFKQLGTFDSSETAFELTYSDMLTNWLSVQPDVQYVMNPGTDPTVDDALVLGSRFTIAF